MLYFAAKLLANEKNVLSFELFSNNDSVKDEQICG